MKKPTPKIYRTTNWSSYNQALIKRGNISIWFDPKTQWYAQPQGKQGRNQTYSDTAIQCCLMIKSLFRLSLRMVTGFVQSLIKLCGLNWTAPDYSTLCRRQKHIDIAISYQKSRDGLHLLVDSTGLKFLGEGLRDEKIIGGVAISSPLLLRDACLQMMIPRNFFYHRHILKAMKDEALAPGAMLSQTEIKAISTARSIYDFDHNFIANLFGFKGADDYYSKNSSKEPAPPGAITKASANSAILFFLSLKRFFNF